MEENEDISRVLFELSSNRRASLLFRVEGEKLKMQQLAKDLDMTATETFRHLQRLIEAKLIDKNVDSTYSITPLGKLATGFLSGFNFIMKNGEFFLHHDVFSLPYEFVNRLSELSGAEFRKEPIAGFNHVRKMVAEAEKFLWTMAEQVDSSTKQPTTEKVSKGVDFRFIMQKELAVEFAKANVNPPVLKGSRYIERIPVTLVVTENEASIVFRTSSGAFDYMGLFGADGKFCKWCQDLFLHYWEKAEHWYPSIQIK